MKMDTIDMNKYIYFKQHDIDAIIKSGEFWSTEFNQGPNEV